MALKFCSNTSAFFVDVITERNRQNNRTVMVLLFMQASFKMMVIKNGYEIREGGRGAHQTIGLLIGSRGVQVYYKSKSKAVYFPSGGQSCVAELRKGFADDAF